MVEDRPLRDDEYPELDDERPARRPQETDAISQAVGSGAYVHRHTLDECVERFDALAARFPERFDRFYFAADGGPLLVDVLIGDQDQWQAQRASKHVEFKQAWCAEHGRRYLVLTEDEADDVNRVRARIAELNGSAATEPAEPRLSKPSVVGQRRRGRVQRPKATAA